jgi:Uma2 family endonuclease
MCAMPLDQHIEYPTSDGQPMAETTLHREVMSDLIWGLERRYADTPDVWVGGNLFLYYRKGDPAAVIAPDVLMARGVTKWERDNYLLWKEEPPCLIFEITSPSTSHEDTRKKKDIYEKIGVQEYILFDPFSEYLKPRLQGFRLQEGRYEPIPPNLDGTLDSRTTGLVLRPEGKRLRLVDRTTGERLLWHEEVDAALVQAERRASEEAAGRRAAEERVRALEAEIARLRGQSE